MPSTASSTRREDLELVTPDELTANDRARRVSIQTETWIKADWAHGIDRMAGTPLDAGRRVMDFTRALAEVSAAVGRHDNAMLRLGLLRLAGRALAWVELLDRDAAR